LAETAREKATTDASNERYENVLAVKIVQINARIRSETGGDYLLCPTNFFGRASPRKQNAGDPNVHTCHCISPRQATFDLQLKSSDKV
jgi:hypothetical protein